MTMCDKPALVAEGTSHRGRADTLHARSVVGHAVLDVEVVDIDVQALLLAEVVRVLHRRTQNLLDQGRNALLGEVPRSGVPLPRGGP